MGGYAPDEGVERLGSKVFLMYDTDIYGYSKVENCWIVTFKYDP